MKKVFVLLMVLLLPRLCFSADSNFIKDQPMSHWFYYGGYYIFFLITSMGLLFKKDWRWAKAGNVSAVSRITFWLFINLVLIGFLKDLLGVKPGGEVLLLILAAIVLAVSWFVDINKFKQSLPKRKSKGKTDLVFNIFTLETIVFLLASLYAGYTQRSLVLFGQNMGDFIWKCIAGYIVVRIILQYTKKIARENSDTIKSLQNQLLGEVLRISDNYNPAFSATLKGEHVNFLIDKFVENGMEENDFYFNSELLEIFFKSFHPEPQLEKFLRDAIRARGQIELHWEK